ncbi:flagellar filament capping protein FliD [Paenibacillus sp. G2S3]|uniref:flagellar filament capping protein FliD n=1 Tax=Paenibacillus sp. G2S3 TaxID=3047872 RepID=UPI0024C1BC26|nr:flagellar filament capping protein FliD [Paenibacillus sp. G2S3]WHY19086.1 flagellar filament capping protein FliD [Paenibacillus sp. G2S3]
MVTRINGFSGMDIDSLVKNMMTAKKVPLNKLYQQKEILNWTRDSYREISSKLYDFRINKLTDKYNVSSALNANKAVVTGNTSAVKAEATANANGIDMEVTVNQLATSTTLETIGVGLNKTSKTTLAELVTGKKYDDLTDSEKEKNYTLNINGVTFSTKDKDGNIQSLFNGTTSIGTLVSTINANSEANVNASFDEITGQLIIRSKALGAPIDGSTSKDGKIELGSENSILTEVFKGVKPLKPGVDAIVKINGSDEIKQKSNTFTINGIQLTLLAETGTNGTTKISSQSDPDKAIETIKSFVEDYNSLLKLLNSKVSEAKYSDYTPLTEEQKKEMKESEILTWTQKAQSGLLKNDDILTSTISSMRMIITENLGKLSDMGITTGTYTEGGKLILDEKKLKQALINNPQSVIDLFQGPASAPNEGLFDKLGDQLAIPLESISKRAGTNKFTADLTSTFKEESVMGKKLKEYNSRIATMLTNLNNAETRYYKQFSAMETAMNKLQSQSNSLFSTSS